ncbi:unnamed protein product [Chilo suppressalis]|uniref:Uncharacterized protein n=1 Tax=Chilo suppressalis TaxID=168631 RepID=A0ABN8LBF2_CHISP|nr:unnamed protein product [Chilo suppressalis]
MANRRKWIDDLRPIKSDEENNKKINVLNEQIYIDGKLVKETNNTERKYDSIKHVSKFQYSSSNDSDWLAHLPLTPHLRKRNVNSLTPTFRSPNSYIRETRKVLKKLTPQKLTYAPSQMEDLGTCEIEHELGSIDFNELIDFHDFKNVNDNNSSLLISVSVDHLSENNNVPRTPSPQPGTSDEPVTYRAASVPRPPSPRPGTSDEPVTYRAASVPRSPSPRPGTSDEPVTYRAASVPRSPSPRPGTSDEPVTYRAASVPRSPSPRPGTSDEPVTYRAASVPRSPSPRPGTSDEPVTYRAASVPRSPSPRPGTSDEPVTYRAASVPRSPSPRPGTSDEQSRDVPSKRQPKRKVKRDHGTKPSFDESYIDFVLDKEDRDTLLLNEAFPSEDSDDWNTSVSDESDEMPKKKKKRKQHKNNISAEKNKPKTQIKKENKKNKNLGKCYKNSKGIIVEEKAMKPNPCANTKCSNRCGEISEERRDRLFSHFWKLESMQRRRDWIAQITEKNYTKSSSVNEPEASRRKFTYTYFINEGEGRRKVCQKFLIDTLDITQKFILYTVTHKIDGFAKSDERGKNVSHNKTPPEILKHVKSFILSLPLLPSHYCRKGSQKLYLQEEIKNITNLY